MERETWCAFKKRHTQSGNELKKAYKKMKREPIAAVAKAKIEAYKDWYDKMGTEEGERVIYKVITNQIWEMLTDEVKIKEKWREYFNNLLNVENDREQLREVPAVEGPVQEISRKEVNKAIESMTK